MVDVTSHVLGFIMEFALIISSKILDGMIKSFSFMNLWSLISWCHNGLLSAELTKIFAKTDLVVLNFGKGIKLR